MSGRRAVTAQDLEDAESRLERIQHAFLLAYGWKYTSATPGAVWLWRRDFADLDVQRQVWDKAQRAGEPGRPSRSTPYGMITADTDLAILMTRATLCEEEPES